MARGINKVILIGNLGNDPEMKYTQGGMAICTLSLATTSVRKDKDGNQQEKTEWHRCVAWNGKTSGLADIIEKYVHKGDKIYLEGSIEYRQWQDKDGQTKYTTEIRVQEILLLGGKGEGGGQGSAAGSSAPRAASPSASKPASKAPAKAMAGAGPAADEFPDATDGDLPF